MKLRKLIVELNELEKKAIKIWTSPEGYQYRYIKGILRGDYKGVLKNYYDPIAKALVGLFKKYPDNTGNKILYRGDVIEGYLCSENEICKKFMLNNPIGKNIILDDTILSFTYSKDIAIKSYTNSEKNKSNNCPTVLYVLKKRLSTFLDISEFSMLPHEKEVLCNKGVKFKVVNIERKENNNLIYYIEEVL